MTDVSLIFLKLKVFGTPVARFFFAEQIKWELREDNFAKSTKYLCLPKDEGPLYILQLFAIFC